MMKQGLLGIGIAVMATVPAFASDNAGAFIEQGIGARAAGMGMAYVSVVGDSQSVYWNPAKLTNVKNIDVNGMVTSAFETNFSNVQVAGPVGEWSMGLGFYGANTPGIRRTTLDTLSDSGRFIATGDEFSYSASAVFLSTGKQITPELSLGASVKVLSEALDSNRASGYGVDVAASYKVSEQLAVAAIVQNALQPRMVWNTASGNVDTVPRNLKIGADYAIFPNWIAAGDIDIRPSRPFKYHLGTEYWVSPIVPIRLGLDNVTTQGGAKFDLTLGTGIYLERLRMDLSWSNPENTVIADVWRFSLGYMFIP